MVVVYDSDVSEVIQSWSVAPYTQPHGISLAKDGSGTYWLYVALNAGGGNLATVKRYDVGSIATTVPSSDSSFILNPQPTGTLSGIAAHPDGTLLVCAGTSGLSRYSTTTFQQEANNPTLTGYTAVDKYGKTRC